MGQGAPIDEAQETIALKASQITPQAPIIDPSQLALLWQGPLALQHRANGLIAG